MDTFLKFYRVLLIVTVIGSGLLFALNMLILSYGAAEIGEVYGSLILFVIFALMLWFIDKMMVRFGLLASEPEYLGFLKIVFKRNKD